MIVIGDKRSIFIIGRWRGTYCLGSPTMVLINGGACTVSSSITIGSSITACLPFALPLGFGVFPMAMSFTSAKWFDFSTTRWFIGRIVQVSAWNGAWVSKLYHQVVPFAFPVPQRSYCSLFGTIALRDKRSAADYIQIIGFEDAIAEFVDNSIQACQENPNTGSRSINISLSVEKYEPNNKYLGM